MADSVGRSSSRGHSQTRLYHRLELAALRMNRMLAPRPNRQKIIPDGIAAVTLANICRIGLRANYLLPLLVCVVK